MKKVVINPQKYSEKISTNIRLDKEVKEALPIKLLEITMSDYVNNVLRKELGLSKEE